MAGESARESARRQREKAERLRRSAELWERGADGEQATAWALDALPRDTWTVFHDVRWPGRRYANVDHVAVGPTGLFVIDSKNWSGTVLVRDQVLRQNGRAREDAVAGATKAAQAVAALTPAVRPAHIHPVLCFVRAEPLAGSAGDVLVCSTTNIVDLLTTRADVLPPDVVVEVCMHLDALLESATAPYPPPTRPAPRLGAKPRRASSKRRRGSAGGLVTAAAALVAFAVLATSPHLLTSLSEGLARVFVTTQVADDKAPTQVPTGRPHRKRAHHGPGAITTPR